MRRGGIVLRENRNENPGLFDSMEKSWCDFFSFVEPFIINEGVDTLLVQRIVDIASETVACVDASEVEEDIISPITGEGRWRR